MFLAGESGLGGEQISACLREYGQTLKDGGVSDFTYEDCLMEFRLGALALFGQRLAQFSIQPREEQAQRLLDMRRNSLERVITVLDEFECGRALE